MKKGEGDKEYLTAREAVQYLAKKWGIESYTMGAFRVYRLRHKLEPDLSTENTSLWKRETLDSIPKPGPKGRPKRTEQQHEDDTDKAA